MGGAPGDAISLIGSSNADFVSTGSGGENPWLVKDGIMTVKPGTGGISSKQSFGDVQLHVEWRSPILGDDKKGQDRGNSGIFLQSLYEVQILDSHGGETYSNGQAGSVYKQHIPLVNATRAAGEWQTYDIIYRAPRFNDWGVVTEVATLTVLHNGVLVQNNVELAGPTVYRGYPAYKPHGKLPIMLQDHGHEVSFRNIWVRELDQGQSN